MLFYSYIESESHTMTLFGNPCLELLKSDRFPRVTRLSLCYIDIDNLISTVPHVRDILPVLQVRERYLSKAIMLSIISNLDVCTGKVHM